jgi:hypothetical protein
MGALLILRISMLFISAMPFCAYAQEKAGLPEEEIAKSNNPLTNIKALYLQNYYVPTFYGSG